MHSKLQTTVWPNVALVLENIHFFQLRIPSLTVQLYSDDSSTSVKNDIGLKLSDIVVSIKSPYQTTASQVKLSSTIEAMDHERLQKKLLERQKRQVALTSQIDPPKPE